METVTLLAPVVDVDEYGNDELDYGDADETTVAGCLFAPKPSEESDEGHNPRQSAVLYCPAGTTVTPTMRAVVRGDVWEVVGSPSIWGGHIGPAGVEVRLERTPAGEGHGS
jgi:hypothetical protein